MGENIVLSFVEAINKQDLNMLIDLMSNDFVFIDTYGGRENKENMRKG